MLVGFLFTFARFTKGGGSVFVTRESELMVREEITMIKDNNCNQVSEGGK